MTFHTCLYTLFAIQITITIIAAVATYHNYGIGLTELSGTKENDYGYSVSVDNFHNTYVTGSTDSSLNQQPYQGIFYYFVMCTIAMFNRCRVQNDNDRNLSLLILIICIQAILILF